MCRYYLRVQTCYPIAKHSNKGYSELMAYVTDFLIVVTHYLNSFHCFSMQSSKQKNTSSTTRHDAYQEETHHPPHHKLIKLCSSIQHFILTIHHDVRFNMPGAHRCFHHLGDNASPNSPIVRAVQSK
jgi:hypothetical protein